MSTQASIMKYYSGQAHEKLEADNVDHLMLFIV
jgi:hypothetical protein